MLERSQWTVAILTILILLAAAERGGAEPPGPPRMPVEKPADTSVVPQSPVEPHPGESAGSVGGFEPASMSFEAAVAATADAEEPQGVQSHVQGSFEQQRPPSEGPGLPGPGTLSPDSSPPEDGSTVAPLAPGDHVGQFFGLSSTGWIPPDTILAVGPGSVVEAVNVGFAVYSKAGGSLQGYTTFSSFFAPVLPTGWQGILFDPRVHYSVEHSKFVLLAIGRDGVNQESYMFIAVSQTTDPTGNWWLYRIAADNPNSADSDSWVDYCGLGADTWGVYVTCNLFRWTGTFKYGKLWTVGPEVFSGGTLAGWGFWDLRWNSNALAFSLQPAIPYTVAGDQATFFANTFSSSGSSVLLWKLTGDRTNSPTLVRSTIGTQVYNAIGENVDQPGSSADLDGGDARIMNAAYQNRKVYTVLTHDVANDGRSSGWLLFKTDVDSTSLDWQHLLWTSTASASGGFYYFYPAITLDGYGGTVPNLAVFGSWTDTETSTSATTNFASGLFKVYTDQPTTGTGPFLNFANGATSYEVRDSANRNRWGDYSGAAFDWSTGAAWGGVEVAGGSTTWNTVLKGIDVSDGCTPDGYEPDGSSGLANGIGAGETQTHSLCPAGDEDWVAFTLANESAITLETSGVGGDTRMWLYDAGLSELEFDDDDGTDLFSFIDRTCGADPLPAGTYYVKVDEFGDDDEIAGYNLTYTLNGPCAGGCPADLVLANTSIAGAQTYRAVSSVTLGPNLQVSGTDVEVFAGDRVVFQSGTSIGGSFSATISPTPCTATPTPPRP